MDQRSRNTHFTPHTAIMTHPVKSPLGKKFGKTLISGAIATVFLGLIPAIAEAYPRANGTWLSKPQITFHTSNNTLDPVMNRMKNQRYKYVFLDVRHVSDSVQQQVTHKIREYGMVPIVWIQSPQLRRMSVQDLIHEARYALSLIHI